MSDDQKTQTDATRAIAGLGIMLGTILGAAQSLVKLATELKPLNDTIARHRDLSMKQLDFLNGRTDSLIAAFGRYDRTCQAMRASFDEATRAHNEAAGDLAQLSAHVNELTQGVRELVALLRPTVNALDALPALVAQHVSEALARAGIDSSARGLH